MNNLGLLFYKTYYDGKQSLSEKNKEIFRTTLTASDYAESGLNGLDGYTCFHMKTTYPGMMVGTGYAHNAGQDDDNIKIGFSFDYTTGQPYVPGSSVKGIIRSFFEKTGFDKETVEGIFEKGGDVFFDAVVYKANRNGRILGTDYITPHKSAFRNPVPLLMLKILPDVVFEFRFILTDDIIQKDEKEELFRTALRAAGVGAKTNVGYGALIPVEQSEAATAGPEVTAGAVLPGTITGITDFGAFVKLDGCDKKGSVSKSEIAAGKVTNINAFLHVGDKVTVKVLKITQNGNLVLSVRQAGET
ncbi:MAG: type III-B CRISPR module RAMP protein Cmr6 [Clostridia bacterium]|nr:type III-B CRISPR module RAMP protein Cmr6 [Clostridia bacterium]